MKLAVLVGASLLVAGSALAQPVAPVLDASKPITVNLVDIRLDEAIGFIGRMAGIAIQWDEKVSAGERSQLVARTSFVNASVEEALALLTREARLTLLVVDAKTVRIRPAAK